MPGGTSAPLNQILTPRSSLAAATDRAAAWLSPPITELGPDPGPTLASHALGETDLLAVCVLGDPRWDIAALAELCRRMGDRRLGLVEPTAALGPRRLAQRLTAGRWRHRLGHDFERDLPTDLRAAGFQLYAVDRFTVGPLSPRSYLLALAAPRRTPSTPR